MTNIRLHCVIDELLKSRRNEIESAIIKAGKAYLLGSDYQLSLKYNIEYKNLQSVPWEYYTVVEDNGVTAKDKYMGFGFNWISQDTKRIWDKSKWAYDCAVYVVAPPNWHTEGAWGWNLGGFWNNYQVQLVKDIQNEYLWKGFAMEIFHAMDDFVYAELGKNLEDILKVGDFDRDVVHGIKNPPFPVFEYQYAISLTKTELVNTFEKRAKRHLASLIEFYLSLLRQYLAYLLNKSKTEPILVEELGEHKYYREKK